MLLETKGDDELAHPQFNDRFLSDICPIFRLPVARPNRTIYRIALQVPIAIYIFFNFKSSEFSLGENSGTKVRYRGVIDGTFNI